jgi:hypothetical protein
MQSGTHQLRKWKIDYDNRERWENPLVGWGSTGDPLSSLHLEFPSKEDAIIYCERMGNSYKLTSIYYMLFKYGNGILKKLSLISYA